MRLVAGEASCRVSERGLGARQVVSHTYTHSGHATTSVAQARTTKGRVVPQDINVDGATAQALLEVLPPHQLQDLQRYYVRNASAQHVRTIARVASATTRHLTPPPARAAAS